MNRVAVITANMGSVDKEHPWIEQSIPADYYLYNDNNFPLRTNAMTPRLQARIPKMFGWQMAPGYDFYIWIDYSLEVVDSQMVSWFLGKLGNFDAVFLKHPDRKTVAEEAKFIEEKVKAKDWYLYPRYANELIDEELKEIYYDIDYEDKLLIASTTFAYRVNDRTINMMKEWWYHTSRYHIVDQLGLPFAICKSGANVRIIDDHYLHLEHLKHIRNASRRRHV